MGNGQPYVLLEVKDVYLRPLNVPLRDEVLEHRELARPCGENDVCLTACNPAQVVTPLGTF